MSTEFSRPRWKSSGVAVLIVVCFLCLGVVTAVGPTAAQSASGEALTGEGDSAGHDIEGVSAGNDGEDDDVTRDAGSVADGSDDNSAEDDSNADDDGSEVRLRMADTDHAIRPSASEAQLATVELNGTGPGRTALTVEVSRFDADAGATLDVLSRKGTVRTGPPAVSDTPPTDPDGDGQYEDVNGNGQLDDGDVELLFENFDRPSVSTYPQAYDFNDNGQVDYDDVVALYEAA